MGEADAISARATVRKRKMKEKKVMKESEANGRGRRADNKPNGMFKVVVVDYGCYSKYTVAFVPGQVAVHMYLLPCEFQ